MRELDLVVIGNAIVDVLCMADDSFLAKHHIQKGVMSLVKEDRVRELCQGMHPAPVHKSGGSGANTAVGVVHLGGSAGFIGKIGDDDLSRIFATDLRECGVLFHNNPAGRDSAVSTATCVVIITPDAARTMQTNLGVSANLSVEDLDRNLIESGRILYLEGYLWDSDSAQQAMREAAAIAKAMNRKVSLSLSDPICVERHRDSLREFIKTTVDILFANQTEAYSLLETTNMPETIAGLGAICRYSCVTVGAKGSMIIENNRVHYIPANPVAKVVDTTGAGDQYASGVLYGICRKQSPKNCGMLGSAMASDVIGHVGARPLGDGQGVARNFI